MSLPTEPRKPGLLQVAKTMCFGLIMIGKRATWERGGDAHGMTSGQVVAGAVISGLVVIAILLAIVQVVLSLAGA